MKSLLFKMFKAILYEFGKEPWVLITLASMGTIFFAFLVILKIVELLV